MDKPANTIDNRGGLPRTIEQKLFARSVAQKVTGEKQGLLKPMLDMRPYADEQKQILSAMLFCLADDYVSLNTATFINNAASIMQENDMGEIRLQMAHNFLLAHGDIGCELDEAGKPFTGLTIATLHEMDQLAENGLYIQRRPPALWCRETTRNLEFTQPPAEFRYR